MVLIHCVPFQCIWKTLERESENLEVSHLSIPSTEAGNEFRMKSANDFRIIYPLVHVLCATPSLKAPIKMFLSLNAVCLQLL